MKNRQIFDDVIACDLWFKPPQSKILATPINGDCLNNFFEELFFWRTLAAVFLVLGLGLEHSCPWPREGLFSERLSLASDFFCVLGLEPCVLDSTSGRHCIITSYTTFIAICSCIDADWLDFCFENENLSSAVARANEVRSTKID